MAPALRSLRAQWALFLFLGAAALAAGAWLLAAHWLPALQWGGLAVAILAAQMTLLWSDLTLNRNKQGRLSPSFGIGNWVSLLRLLLLSALAAFLAFPWPYGAAAWLPFVVCLLFNIGDLLDGYLARVTGSATKLGERLDLALDGRGVLVAALLAWHYGAVGWWYLLVGLARYLFVFGIWLRGRFGLRFTSFENPLRRPLAGVQMGVGTAMLAPGLPVDLTLLASSLTMIPFLANFSYDWLVGIGWLRQAKSGGPSSALDWLVLAIRLAIGALLLAAAPPLLVSLFGVAVVLGIGGRAAVFGLLIVLAASLLSAEATSIGLAIIAFGLLLLYFGVGRFTLLAINESWLFRRQGAPRRKPRRA
jgi:CDP-diacylglycerol--glycerol-3-phosphate 3-phosphatidyltransferase